MSSYFTLPSFARARKNTEELEKTNPQTPVLKDEDESFLRKQISSEQAARVSKDVPITEIADDGEEKRATKDARDQIGATSDQFAVPEPKVEAADGTQESKEKAITQDGVNDPLEEGSDRVEATTPVDAKKAGKNKALELPSQEEAEAATRDFKVGSTQSRDRTQDEKRTWASYLPPLSALSRKDETAGEGKDETAQRTWTQFASAYIPSMPAVPSIPSLPASWTNSKDGKLEPIYNKDGTINEEETRKKQEQEVSVLLDNLNMSNINNRVFALSGETQKIYERFAQVLRDTMNGAPTAYDDMEKFMKDAGPQLEKHFKSMPPFVQTLVKSLPAKLSTTLAPELLAAASGKPGADLKSSMDAADKRDAAGAGAGSTTTGVASNGQNKKKKRRIPGLKSLISKEGAVANILRNVVNFLRVRFPFLASTTNVVLSLAVFILMFVFWYCHKRGKETRLAKEAEDDDEEEGDNDVSDDDDDDDEADDSPGGIGGMDVPASEPDKAKSDILNLPDPSQVPLPEKTEAGD